LDLVQADALVFHASTRQEGEQILTSGGRVLGVTGLGEDLPQALQAAYQTIARIQFDGMHYRTDIGKRQMIAPSVPQSAYAASGVSIDAGNQAVDLMRSAVQSTYGAQVLAGIGAFGGLFDATEIQSMQHPVLVASTDSVGTKVKLAAQAGSYASIGQDLVNHCINDILVQGARPLFFLDYFAASHLKPEVVADVVSGIAAACRESGCALIGGETAEMPGVYAEGEFDLAGTIVGVVERSHILPRQDIQPGDVLLGLRSSGPHTNGYSLIRKIFAGVPLDALFPELDQPLGEALLAPHRSYLPLLRPVLDRRPSPIKALVHLTGGGFLENIPRILPDGIGAHIRLDSWPVPPLFRLIQVRGDVPEQEMYRVFNMGIGLLAVLAPEQAAVLQAAIPEETWLIGDLVAGRKVVSLV
jgi:phosphoribosylaminoimidazole synthetase